MIWSQLKEFCNSLPNDRLLNEVILWREDEVIYGINSEALSEDHYIGECEEGCYPESDATKPIESLKKVYSKGDPILWENF